MSQLKVLVISCFLLIFLSAATQATAQDQTLEKKAIDRGAAFLLSQQKPDGSWPHYEKVGMTSLIGLSLVRAGVPKNLPV